MSGTGQDNWSNDPGQQTPGSGAGSSEESVASSWDSPSGSGQQADAWGQQAAAQQAQQSAWGQQQAYGQQAQQSAWGQQGYGQQQAAAQPQAQQSAWGQSAYGQQQAQQSAWGQQQPAAQSAQQAQQAQQSAWGQQQAYGQQGYPQQGQVGYPAAGSSGGGFTFGLAPEKNVAIPWAGFILLGGALLALVSIFLPWFVSGSGDFKISSTGWDRGNESLWFKVQLLIFMLLAGLGLLVGVMKLKSWVPLIGLTLTSYLALESLVTMVDMVTGEGSVEISNIGVGFWLYIFAWLVAAAGAALAALFKPQETS